MKLCPCGFLGDHRNRCNCTEREIKRYTGKISGPLLDRIDIHLLTQHLEFRELNSRERGEESAVIRKRVDRAREIQLDRYRDSKNIHCNAHMASNHIEKYCKLDISSKNLLHRSVDRLGLSARAYHRILKVARTIADLDQKSVIDKKHLAEAIQLSRKII